MNRPMYESQSDVTRENRMKALLETKWNCELNKLPIKYHLDWMAMRGSNPNVAIMAVREGRPNPHRKRRRVGSTCNRAPWALGVAATVTA